MKVLLKVESFLPIIPDIFNVAESKIKFVSVLTLRYNVLFVFGAKNNVLFCRLLLNKLSFKNTKLVELVIFNMEVEEVVNTHKATTENNIKKNGMIKIIFLILNPLF